MRIQVTEEDLRLGMANDCSRCPVARAILRQVPDIEFIDIDGESVIIKFVCNPRRNYPLPLEVQNQIALIDDGQQLNLAPFSFELGEPLP